MPKKKEKKPEPENPFMQGEGYQRRLNTFRSMDTTELYALHREYHQRPFSPFREAMLQGIQIVLKGRTYVE
jgi:hypothetical protein